MICLSIVLMVASATFACLGAAALAEDNDVFFVITSLALFALALTCAFAAGAVWP